MFGKFIEQTFWNLYALCYDSITKLVPYQNMQMEILTLLQPKSHYNILDAGCGTGNFIKLLSHKVSCQSITAIDSSSIMLGFAKRKNRNSNIIWEILDLNKPLPYNNETFDHIICTNVLFALENPYKALLEFKRVLKPGGKIIISTPKNHFDTDKILRAHTKTLQNIKDWSAFIPLILPLMIATLLNKIIRWKSKKQIYHFFTIDQLHALLDSTGFHPLTIISTYADQNWLLMTTKPVEGIQSNAELFNPSNKYNSTLCSKIS